jgi:polar amino acid transport system substrate-binding protein
MPRPTTRRPRLLATTLLLAGGALVLAGCGGSDSTTAAGTDCTPAHEGLQTLTDGTLTVAVYVSPPSTKQQGTTFTGVDPAVIAKVAAMECLTPKEQATSGAAVISQVQASRVDLAVGGIYHSAERAKAVSLTDPLYQDGMAILSSAGYADLDALGGHTVGVVQGALWNADLQAVLGDDVKLYQDTASAKQDLANGRIDAGVFSSAEAAYLAEGTDLAAEPLPADDRVRASASSNDVVLAVDPRNDALLAALNADIATLLADGTIATALSDNGMDATLAGSGTKG